ncbi:MAG: tRNA uridine-5-carboxymethylaminomethyl(34) synthesis GTPase MnmE [Pseudomonadota bacterium]
MPRSGEAETIFALATSQGRAGVAVFRISGPKAVAAAEHLCGSVGDDRKMCRRELRDEDGGLIDDALVVTFLHGRSFTGENVVEIHAHGSIAVSRAISKRLRALEFVRDAEPGEFTRRAFENGRLDLTQVEGLADLIDAETEAQRRQAMSVYEGGLKRELAAIKTSLLRASALCAASIDFADEEVPDDLVNEIAATVETASNTIGNLVAGHVGARRIVDGIEVAIIGAPNAGKSTLMNAMTGEEVAIVTDQAGTTRDVLECRLDMGGQLVRLLDTAGLRETDDIIEKEGVRRARARAAAADIRMFLYEGAAEKHDLQQSGDIVVLTKADINARAGAISAKTGAGMNRLMEELRVRVQDLTPKGSFVASERQAVLLGSAREACGAALTALQQELGPEVVSQEIGQGLRAIEEVVGRVGVEDVLGEVFSSFCIGK